MDEAALARLDAAVQADIDAGLHFGASLLVARGGNIVHRADLGTVAPNRPAASDDRYLLMSMSKAFTAVLVLRAIEHGRFRLDTRVDEVLPGFGVGGKEKATVQQLLCHTSGLPTALVPPPLPLSAIGDLPAKWTPSASSVRYTNRARDAHIPPERVTTCSGRSSSRRIRCAARSGASPRKICSIGSACRPRVLDSGRTTPSECRFHTRRQMRLQAHHPCGRR